jgi:hypothetical protein
VVVEVLSLLPIMEDGGATVAVNLDKSKVSLDKRILSSGCSHKVLYHQGLWDAADRWDCPQSEHMAHKINWAMVVACQGGCS